MGVDSGLERVVEEGGGTGGKCSHGNHGYLKMGF